MNIGLEIICSETFKRIQEFVLSPIYTNSAMYSTEMIINRLKIDLGSSCFLHLLMHNSVLNYVKFILTCEDYSPVDVMINYVLSDSFLGKFAMW